MTRVTSCCETADRFIVSEEMRRERSVAALAATADSSYWRRKRPWAPAAFRSSMPSTASTSSPCRSDCCCIWDIIARRSAPWIIQEISSISGTASSGTQPMGPPMTKVMATKMTMKGRSERAASVAEAKNSRTSSICANWCA